MFAENRNGIGFPAHHMRRVLPIPLTSYRDHLTIAGLLGGKATINPFRFLIREPGWCTEVSSVDLDLARQFFGLVNLRSQMGRFAP